jgi:hypothetical protein
MTLQDFADLGQVAVGVAAIIASLAAAYFVYFGTKKMSRLDYERSVRDAWMTVDNAVLEHNDLLEVADTLFNPADQAGISDVRRKKRWLAYMILNPLASGFYGCEHGMTDGQAKRGIEAMLKLILHDDDVYMLTQSGVHEEAFIKWCRELRAQLPAAAPPANGRQPEGAPIPG